MTPRRSPWFGLPVLLQAGAMQFPGAPPPGWGTPPEAFWPEEAPAETATTSARQDSAEVAGASHSRWLLGAYGAAFVPVGDWVDHPYAGRTLGSVTYDDNLDQFGPGVGAGVELGWEPGKVVLLTLQVEATTLATGEWEAEAARQGSDLSSHAAQLSTMFLLSIRLVESQHWRMHGRLGVGFMHAWGRETLSDPAISYDYSFLKTSFATRAGLGNGYRISSNVDLTLLVDFVLAAPGVQYPRHSEPYMGVAALLGPRIWFGAERGAS